MAAKLIQPMDSIDVKQVCALVYGQPGARKTSLCQTADNPITLAFDPGVHRAFGRRAAVIFDSWKDVVGFDLKPYKTIIVDTIGMALEKLGAAIIAENSKHGNRMGGLSLQGYGVLKNQFALWVGSIKQSGQDLVFTAHEKNEKNGDAVYYCPDIVGGSYATIMNVCDVVGYAHFEGGKRVLDFGPTDQWMAKVPPWPRPSHVELPDFATAPDFLARLLDEAKSSMGRISAESAALAATVKEWQDKIEAAKDLDQLNAILPGLSALSAPAKSQVWSCILASTERAGLIFHKDSKKFVPKVPASGVSNTTGATP